MTAGREELAVDERRVGSGVLPAQAIGALLLDVAQVPGVVGAGVAAAGASGRREGPDGQGEGEDGGKHGGGVYVGWLVNQMYSNF